MIDIKKIIKELFYKSGSSKGRSFKELFVIFQQILTLNNHILDLIADANQKLGGDYIFDKRFIEQFVDEISTNVQQLIFALNEMVPGKYKQLFDVYQKIEFDLREILAGHHVGIEKYVLSYDDVSKGDEDSVGGKNATLCEVKKHLDLAIPHGFAITFFAYVDFLNSAGLLPFIKDALQKWERGEVSSSQVGSVIQSEIQKSKIPSELKHEIKEAINDLKKKVDESNLFVVRSSAWAEDSEHSFAGLYDSIVGVKDTGILDAYKKVIASTFNPKVMEYRRRIGFKEDEILMAVCCQQLIPSKVSGVVYTLNPTEPDSDTMIISASWGLGGLVVSGKETGDIFWVDRDSKRIVGVEIAWKEYKKEVTKSGEIELVEVEEDLKMVSTLSTKEVKEIADIALSIEKYFKKPQDIEFCIDKKGKLVILQTRPLGITKKRLPRAKDLRDLESKYEIIIKDKGITAQEGIAVGTIYVASQDDNFEACPTGAIVVARYASPRMAKIVPKASGIITEVGSVTGHLATICREYSVPALFNVSGITGLVRPGEVVTLDAEDKKIYKGKVKELYFYSLSHEPIGDTYEYRLLRRILRKIEPLHLAEPTDSNFKPEFCKTFHDITRFIHEKAVETIVDLHFYGSHDPETFSGKLEWDIPLDLIIIDIGGGLKQLGESSESVHRGDIQSIPMNALLDGIGHPGAWDSGPMSVDVSSFMSSLTRTFSLEHMSPKAIGQNLAVISKNYVNLSLRLGYHFTMVDSYVTSNIAENYIYFRFFGGVTDLTRRSRRAKMISEVLEHYDFRVETHGDLVVARLKRLDKRGIINRLYLLGLLIGYTRQLDVMMINDDQIDIFAEKIRELMEDKNE
ncbi:Phosphoenolpyruvate synthase [Dissulfuribacter thermophilus]|uniref:Phosphoenolpyruvate synthase n=1 Tax=Dissulfuribacter thermophilus TaxID=1156395 RepID=A0A1B9F8F1_9BACT|nr:PEP/pyruvate-binding domain-containing protein [Dissulfuribacter thermophilus]OCC16153.1 Phosphoenolpyruvate synthase [Dissulfuribacter thermophilus]